MQQAWSKFKKNPFGLVRNVVQKGIIARLRYGHQQAGYDAARYWDDRLRKYGGSLRGVGDEGLSENDNARQYQEAAQAFRGLWQSLGLTADQVATLRVLEVGTGTGFYTRLLHELGVRTYTGVDITDALFAQLQAELPTFRFQRADVTDVALTSALVGLNNLPYDLLIILDVIEHIVTDEKFAQAMATLDSCLRPGGKLIIAPLMAKAQKHLFYVRFWSFVELQRFLPSYRWGEPVAFRNSYLYVGQKPDSFNDL